MGKGEGSFYKNRKKELWFFGEKCHNSVHLWVELKYCFRSNQENKFHNFSLRSHSFMCCRWIVCQSVLIPRNSHALRKFWGLIVILEQFIGGKTCNGAQLVAVGERALPFFENWKRVPWFWKNTGANWLKMLYYEKKSPKLFPFCRVIISYVL